ncbi:dipeptidylpeptidase [Mycoemilia scoparia]|uniref:Dipeptidyl-peptidase V n=1 Tax=Mycoemilia scoparia TaxID=417184 RepID=A0A9W8A4E0_9FUNG|nr:dipeptidylpeptidase [Mycoemilia scoparia]
MSAIANGASKGAFSPEDLVQAPRFKGSIAVSPEGSAFSWLESTFSIKDGKPATKLQFGRDLDASKQQESLFTLLEQGEGLGGQISNVIWLDAETIAFLVNKEDGSEVSTLYAIPVLSSNGDNKPSPLKIGEFPIFVDNLKYNSRSKKLVFTAEVYANESLADTAEHNLREKKRIDTAQAYDDLWIRHWDTFVTEKRNQVFSQSLSLCDDQSCKENSDKSGVNIYKLHDEPVCISNQPEGAESPLDVSNGFQLSLDGKYIAFNAKYPNRQYAWSTKNDIYIAATDGRDPAKSLTSDNQGACSSPAFSQDGRYLAWLQMSTPGYEADINRVIIFDTKEEKYVQVLEDWDRSPSSIIFSEDSSKILVTFEEDAREKLGIIDVEKNSIKVLLKENSVSFASKVFGEKVYLNIHAIDKPNDIYTLNINTNELHRRTFLGDYILNKAQLGKAEDFEFVGANNDTVHGLMVRPYGFDPKKKYPVAFLIHGGPQGSWTDSWSTRWNPAIYAASGFVTVMVNFHGSTGYGQEFCDSIKENWGGWPFEDLMRGLDHVIETYPFVDSDKLAALGASYGGYSINWINGHTDRFRCLVNHDGMFSSISTYYSTEELYFPEREFGGVPWDPEARKVYEKWSPEKYVSNWKTPCLVIHGGKDYRLTDTEGFSTFTALRRQNIPARLLYFPDENHWVLKNGNSLRWHREVLQWITHWTASQKVKPVLAQKVFPTNANGIKLNQFVIQAEKE